MTTKPLDLPALDKLHASYVKVTGTTADDMAKRYANLAAVEAIWDAYPALSARLKILEQTLRGVIEEKSDKRLEYFNNGDDDDWEEINNQIAWLERALGGEL